MSTFDKLTEQREVQRVTQRKMAKYLKCTQWTLCRYENGKRKISAEMQDEYADKLGIELKLMIK